MTSQREEGVPPLRNEDVTGMNKDKQDEVIEASGRASRSDAASEFYEEGEAQARATDAPSAGQREKGATPTGGKSAAEHGTQGEDETELGKHWVEGSQVARGGGSP